MKRKLKIDSVQFKSKMQNYGRRNEAVRKGGGGGGVGGGGGGDDSKVNNYGRSFS